MKRIFILGTFAISFLLQAAQYEFGVIADAGNWNKNTVQVRDAMLRGNVLNLVMAGDNLYEGNSYSAMWDPWLTQGFWFDVTAIGNHNLSYQDEIEYFDMPAEYYSKAYGNAVRFIVLNSDNEKNVNEQMKFLEAELIASQEPFIFLMYHHPTFSLSHLHSWKEKKEFQKAIRPLLKRYRSKITSLILGHDHLALVAHFDDLPVIMNGATQELRRDFPVNRKQSGVKVKTNWFFDRKPYWVKMVVDDVLGTAKFDYIRATDDALRCTVTIQTGLAAALGENCK